MNERQGPPKLRHHEISWIKASYRDTWVNLHFKVRGQKGDFDEQSDKMVSTIS